MFTNYSLKLLGLRLTGSHRYVFAIFEEALTPASSEISESGVTDLGAYTRTIPTFLSLYIFGMIYELILVWDALRMKNTIQIIGLCLYNIGLVVYAGVQWDELNTATDYLSSTLTNQDIWADLSPFLTAIPCVLALGTVLMTIAAWKLYDEFAWAIYKHISADLRMKRRYLTFQVWQALRNFTLVANIYQDLYRASKIRFLLLSRLHNPISRRCSGKPH